MLTSSDSVDVDVVDVLVVVEVVDWSESFTLSAAVEVEVVVDEVDIVEVLVLVDFSLLLF